MHMRYLLLIGSDDKNQTAPPKAEMEAIVQGHARAAQELRATGKMVHAERLRPDSDGSRIRVKAGQRQVMDGPFTETKEALGGFSPVACATRGGGGAWAREVRPGEVGGVAGRRRWPM